MLPRDIRCHVISLLLGAVKIERDQHIVSGALIVALFPYFSIVISRVPFCFPCSLGYEMVVGDFAPYQDHTIKVCTTSDSVCY